MSEKWPKQLPEFTEEQKRIKDDFMKKWLEQFPKNYGIMEVFNQNYPSHFFSKYDKYRKTRWSTLEIGGARKPCAL